jgi:hypothetical protein
VEGGLKELTRRHELGAFKASAAMLSALAYVAITCAMGHRVLASPAGVIASDPGDPLLNAAILAWNAQHVPWTDAWFQFPIFHPTVDALTLSEHLLGVSVIASPLYWLTGSPAAAYNLALLLSYPLCGMAMYAFVWRLTRSAPAAFLAGLAFAFAPYRVSQLPHVQMLTVFYAPLALLGLHAFVESAGAVSVARAKWLALFAVCWVLQGAANGYLLVYFSVLVALWALWFLASRRRWRDAAMVAAAGAVALLPLAPVLYRYREAHQRLGLSRNLGEIASFGADIGAPLCAADRLAFWGWLRVGCAPEGELFAGAGLIALCLGGIVWNGRREARGFGNPTSPLRPQESAAAGAPKPAAMAAGSAVRRLMRRAAIAIAIVFLAIVLSVAAAGPWRIDLGWIRASASSFDKPLSSTLALLLIAFLLSNRFRTAVARGSAATFYAGAAIVCWVLSWGPFPRFFGVEALYWAPYGWLLQLPGVDGLRVPARFWMMTVLCLSVLAGLTAAGLLRGRSRPASAVIVGLAAGALLIDGWATVPVAAVPPPVASAESLRGAPVLVVPAGRLERDVTAVYHAVAGHWRSINGFSGYEPGYYEALRTLSSADDPRVADTFLRLGDLNVVDGGGVRLLRARSRGDALPVPGERLDAHGRDASCSPEGMVLATDGNVETRWVCGPQNADHQITFDLGRVAQAGAIVHALGSTGADFPRHLTVETSLDASAWEPAWEGSPAAAVMVAAMDAPRLTRVVIPFRQRAARYLRLRQTGRHGSNYWSIAELEVWSGQPRG